MIPLVSSCEQLLIDRMVKLHTRHYVAVLKLVYHVSYQSYAPLLYKTTFISSPYIFTWTTSQDSFREPTLIARFMVPTWGPIWDRQGPGGPHVGPMNFAIWVIITLHTSTQPNRPCAKSQIAKTLRQWPTWTEAMQDQIYLAIFLSYMYFGFFKLNTLLLLYNNSNILR